MNQTVKRVVVRTLRFSAVALIAGLSGGGGALAVPPHPSLLEARAKAKAAGQTVCSLPSTSDLHERGICTPEDFFGLKTAGKNRDQNAAVVGTIRILALLVDFSDETSQVTASFFDNLVFGASTGTVKDYLDEISYATIDLVTVNLPSSIGWNRAPQTYAYYVGSNYGMGTYPQNSQKLVEDLVDAVDGVVDFSQYDNDANGYVDVVLVIHAGTGAENSGSAADIWSHKWGIDPRMTGDGVYVSSYTIQPEYWFSPGDMTCGVYSHELLHGFGLPDLYDTDNSSNGIGAWGIMAYGSWNGTMGSSPAHPCAWSRIQLGVSTAWNITSNTNGLNLLNVNGGGQILRLWTSGAASNEYFLVENRRRIGYDVGLPGQGLLIWHIDDGKTTNRQEWWPGEADTAHYMVALEQADGLYELEHLSGQGDGADCWPGTLSRTNFTGATFPASDGYGSGGSFVAVENIPSSSALMTIDVKVAIAASAEDEAGTLPDQYTLSQNYPNPFNPSTTIAFSLEAGGSVQLDVYNLLGQHVKTLLDGFVSTGSTEVEWDGTSSDGAPVASGTYFYKLTVDNAEESKKMLLLK